MIKFAPRICIPDNKLGTVGIVTLPDIAKFRIWFFFKPLSCHATDLLMIFQESQQRSTIHCVCGYGWAEMCCGVQEVGRNERECYLGIEVLEQKIQLYRHGCLSTVPSFSCNLLHYNYLKITSKQTILKSLLDMSETQNCPLSRNIYPLTPSKVAARVSKESSHKIFTPQYLHHKLR